MWVYNEKEITRSIKFYYQTKNQTKLKAHTKHLSQFNEHILMVKSLDNFVIEFIDVSGCYFNILFYIDFTSMGNDIKYFSKISYHELDLPEPAFNDDTRYFYFLTEKNQI